MYMLYFNLALSNKVVHAHINASLKFGFHPQRHASFTQQPCLGGKFSCLVTSEVSVFNSFKYIAEIEWGMFLRIGLKCRLFSMFICYQFHIVLVRILLARGKITMIKVMLK